MVMGLRGIEQIFPLERSDEVFEMNDDGIVGDDTGSIICFLAGVWNGFGSYVAKYRFLPEIERELWKVKLCNVGSQLV